MPEPLVRMAKIKKSFGHVQALQDVDLELYPAEILGLVGDNRPSGHPTASGRGDTRCL